MDITPLIPSDRQVIQGYGSSGFRINGAWVRHSVIVFPDRVVPWAVGEAGEISLENLADVLAAEPAVEILLVGCGSRHVLLPRGLREALRARGVAVESMDTGAACRTYNVLMAEDRRVAAALISLA